jgi:hypothetical protein
MLLDLFYGLLDQIQIFIGQNIAIIFILVAVPLFVVWGLLTIGIVSFFFLRDKVIVMPWSYKYNVTVIRPFTDGRLSVSHDRGANCVEYGFGRLKIEKLNVVMQMPSTTEIDEGRHVVVIALSPTNLFVGKTLIDYNRKVVWIDCGDPQVGTAYFVDKVVNNDPDWLFNHADIAGLFLATWVGLSIFIAAINITMFFPFTLSNIFW